MPVSGRRNATVTSGSASATAITAPTSSGSARPWRTSSRNSRSNRTASKRRLANRRSTTVCSRARSGRNASATASVASEAVSSDVPIASPATSDTSA